jgi:hypothetical protein
MPTPVASGPTRDEVEAIRARHATDADRRIDDDLPAHHDRGLLVAALDAAARERDEARQNLGNLLAVIHRDGGQYVAEHGWAKATVYRVAYRQAQPAGAAPAGGAEAKE